MIVSLDPKSMATATLILLYMTWRSSASVDKIGNRNRTLLSGLSDKLSPDSDIVLLTN